MFGRWFDGFGWPGSEERTTHSVRSMELVRGFIPGRAVAVQNLPAGDAPVRIAPDSELGFPVLQGDAEMTSGALAGSKVVTGSGAMLDCAPDIAPSPMSSVQCGMLEDGVAPASGPGHYGCSPDRRHRAELAICLTVVSKATMDVGNGVPRRQVVRRSLSNWERRVRSSIALLETDFGHVSYCAQRLCGTTQHTDAAREAGRVRCWPCGGSKVGPLMQGAHRFACRSPGMDGSGRGNMVEWLQVAVSGAVILGARVVDLVRGGLGHAGSCTVQLGCVAAFS